MVKQRFTSVDVRAMVNSIRPFVDSCFVSNVYDVSQKVYLIKFQGSQNAKQFLLIESGIRFHLTEYDRDKSALPSSHSVKLRKHLRGRRLGAVSQMGTDRVLDLTFGYEENAVHLIVEFYVQGNVILTDSNYKILMVLRNQ